MSEQFFDNFEAPSFSLSGVNGKDQNLQFNIWQGLLSMVIWDKGSGSKGPVFKRNLNPDIRTLVLRKLRELAKASPETKLPLMVGKWDQEEKKYKNDYLLAFIKDGEQINQIQLSFKGQDGSDQTYTFNLMGAGGISIGSDPSTKAERSNTRLESFTSWWKTDMPQGLVITKRKFKLRNNNTQSSGGGNQSSSGKSSGGGSFFE